ncbi:MAG: hypothetical protein LRS43_04415, partial [Desulfurococcales archaeon]|nr:hypothetical protein [Desulfurococcales archaeon]
MARLFYFTMGFHENFALRRLASHGVDSRDSILVATLKPAIPGVKDAFESLRLYASKSGVRRIELLEVPLDPVGGLASSAFFILDRLHRYVSLGYRLIVADLTGGSRPLIVASMIALIMASESADIDLWLQSDTGGSWESRMPPGIISLIKRGLSREKEALLVFLAEKPGASVEELTERL